MKTQKSASISLKTRSILVAVFTAAIVSLYSCPASAAFQFSRDSGLNATAKVSGYDTASTATPEALIAKILEVVLSFLGVIFLGLMIYAGIMWMTAQGEEQKAAQAKKIIAEAVIGLIIVTLAYALVYFLSKTFSSSYLAQ